MITYRHHIVSLVAVFLALAVGIVLGGGPLSELGRHEAATARAAERTDQARAVASFGDDFAAATAEKLYAGKLAEHPVAILAAPGVDEQAVAALSDQVALAGGSVTARYDLAEALLDPSEKSLVDTLGSQLMTRLGEGAVDADAPTYTRLGELLSLAVATDEETSVPAGAWSTSVRESLSAADLVVMPKGDPGRAPLVLVVLGDDLGASATEDAADATEAAADERARTAILSGLLSGLTEKAAGVVVAGSTDGGSDGSLAALRREAVAAELTTVDGVESPLGQVTTTLALVRALSGQRGAFGASGADGAVPLT
ncbi:copper transporter [Nocardioides ferulae]|uniref:copper transporter n=1 Tax=Nocardioides ferulae TaxID=2340821 RepID=UPI0013DD8E83|nr:copper transporter [Nocardioides ferulae]